MLLLQSQVQSPGLWRLLGPRRWDSRTALITLLSLAQTHPRQWKTSYFQTIFSLFNGNRKKSCSEMRLATESFLWWKEELAGSPELQLHHLICLNSQTTCGSGQSQEVLLPPLHKRPLSHDHLWFIGNDGKRRDLLRSHALLGKQFISRVTKSQKTLIQLPLHCYTLSFTVSLQMYAPCQTCS